VLINFVPVPDSATEKSADKHSSHADDEPSDVDNVTKFVKAAKPARTCAFSDFDESEWPKWTAKPQRGEYKRLRQAESHSKERVPQARPTTKGLNRQLLTKPLLCRFPF